MDITFEAKSVALYSTASPTKGLKIGNYPITGSPVSVSATLTCCDFCSYPQLDHKSPWECLRSICKEIYRNVRLRWKWRNK